MLTHTRTGLATVLALMVLGISGCYLGRGVANLVYPDAFDMSQYKGKKVAVLPVVVSPSAFLSPDDSKDLQEVVARTFTIAFDANAYPVSKTGQELVTFPYLPQVQASIGKQPEINAPATLGISVPFVTRGPTGRILTLTLTLSFVTSATSPDAVHQWTATQAYGAQQDASQKTSLDIDDYRLEWSVLHDLLATKRQLSQRSLTASAASVSGQAPVLRVTVDPKLLSDSGNSGFQELVGVESNSLTTRLQTLPVSVFVTYEGGLKSVDLENAASTTTISLLAPGNTSGPQRPPPLYYDRVANVPLVVGRNDIVVRSTGTDDRVATKHLLVQQIYSEVAPINILSIGAFRPGAEDQTAVGVASVLRGLNSHGGSLVSTVTLTGSDASYEGIQTSLRRLDRTTVAISGAAVVYVAARALMTEAGLRVLPYNIERTDAIELGIPIAVFASSKSPRDVFLDLCVDDNIGETTLQQAEAALDKALALTTGDTSDTLGASLTVSLAMCSQPTRLVLGGRLQGLKGWSLSSGRWELTSSALREVVGAASTGTVIRRVGGTGQGAARVLVSSGPG